MDSLLPGCGAGAADFQEQTDAERSICFVREKMSVGAVAVPAELLRPVALAAGLFGWAKVMNGGFDWLVIIVSDHAHELVNPVELGFDVRFSAFADVAGDAIDSRVRRVEVGRELRFHRRVAGLSAELDGLGVVIGLVTAKRREHDEKTSRANEKGGELSIARPREIDGELVRGLLGIEVAQGAVMSPGAGGGEHEPDYHEARRDYIRQDAHVRVAMVREQVDAEKEKEREQTAAGDDEPTYTHPVFERDRPFDGGVRCVHSVVR